MDRLPPRGCEQCFCLLAVVAWHSELPAVWTNRFRRTGAAGKQLGAITDRVAPHCEPPLIKVLVALICL